MLALQHVAQLVFESVVILALFMSHPVQHTAVTDVDWLCIAMVGVIEHIQVKFPEINAGDCFCRVNLLTFHICNAVVVCALHVAHHFPLPAVDVFGKYRNDDLHTVRLVCGCFNQQA